MPSLTDMALATPVTQLTKERQFFSPLTAAVKNFAAKFCHRHNNLVIHQTAANYGNQNLTQFWQAVLFPLTASVKKLAVHLGPWHNSHLVLCFCLFQYKMNLKLVKSGSSRLNSEILLVVFVFCFVFCLVILHFWCSVIASALWKLIFNIFSVGLFDVSVVGSVVE